MRRLIAGGLGLALAAVLSPVSAARASPAGVLVLYDRTGSFGWLGELHAVYAGNLASRFDTPAFAPVTTYTAGDAARYRAVLYVGSTYDEALPGAFLDDVYAGPTPVVWMGNNIWQLTERFGDFSSAFGWMWSGFDTSPIASIRYRGSVLTRDPAAGALMSYSSVAPAVAVVGEAIRPDGSSTPWAVRSRHLWYIGEVPFTFASETDRALAFADLLFDVLAPDTADRHRALVRLEDVHPETPPAHLRSLVDVLVARGIPFSIGVIPVYRDPLGARSGGPDTVRLAERPALLAELRRAVSLGAVLLAHGYSHQYGAAANPFNGLTRFDYEFFRASLDASGALSLDGPVLEDSLSWVRGRLTAAAARFSEADLAVPAIFEVPHYAASDLDYRAIAERFGIRWERTMYFSGVLGGVVDHSRRIDQMFPYPVRDVYGSTVIPENLGSYEPADDPATIQPRSAPDIVAAARANLAVRDGFASFYFHPGRDPAVLEQIIDGIVAAGYTFVPVSSLLESDPPREVSAAIEATARPLLPEYRAAWSAADATGIGSFEVRARSATYASGFGAWRASIVATSRESARFSIGTGVTECISVRARDRLGTVSGWTDQGCATAPVDDRRLERVGSWRNGTGSGYYLGTTSTASATGAVLRLRGVSARRIWLHARRCASCGVVDVLLGARRLARIDLARGSAGRARILVASFSSSRVGTITIRVVRRGAGVVIDGVQIDRA